MDKFDVGLVGYWFATNYGSVITYYALYSTINNMGYSTVLIDRPEKEKDPEGEDVFSRNFLKKYCNISDSVSWEKLDIINDVCDTFVIGSDQVWTSSALRIMRYMFFLSFADSTKKKIAYAPSFGSSNFFKITSEQEKKIKVYLDNFDNISVREVEGAEILKNRFGVVAERMLDPVFLMSEHDYSIIADNSELNINGEYILAYILDPDLDKEILIKKVSEKLSTQVKIVLDGRKGTFIKNKNKLSIYGEEELLENVIIEDWIKLFKDASYVITDSHHGLAMAIIYNKNYICYANHSRGYNRFISLLSLLEMTDRLVENSEQVTDTFLNTIVDFTSVNLKLVREREKSLKWLKNALEMPKEKLPSITVSTPEVKITYDPDLERCRMLASLMRDYGIRHVVLSSGTRHVNLVRFFEENECFTTYKVVDERSAGFFAIGLSLKLKETIAICCTSGTAASNYVSPVSEAFYQGVPLVVITADRYPCLLGQQEQQMVPQMNIFKGVVKKSVQLPVDDTFLGKWETRRMICDCLLEINHRGSGPVHIDVPIKNIIRKKPNQEILKLGSYCRIFRIPYLPDRTSWNRSIERLKQSHRILLFWGQSTVLNDDELDAVNKFAQHFDCVICTDYLSNLCCYKSVHIYNLMRAISTNEQVKSELAPDILITVGGNNIAGIEGVVTKSKNFEHWNVLPDGRISDPYKKLYRVFECNAIQFIMRMNAMANEFNGGDTYYRNWMKYKPASEKLPDVYGQKYAVGKVIMEIPEGSDLHLANSNTVRLANEYELNKHVTVYCNRGTNGIDGSASSFMGMCAVSDRLCFLLTGDLSFFYDINSLWNKDLKGNIRIMLFNNNGSSLLKHHNSPAITYNHNAVAEGWVRSLGFKYLSSKNKEEFDDALPEFLAESAEQAVFFEVFC